MIGTQYAPGEVCIPSRRIIATNDSNPDDIQVWGDFWVDNFKVVRDVFKRIAPIELAYREQPEDLAPVFEDIRQTALCISTRGLEGKGQFQLLQDGITSMQPFTIGSRYVIEDATVDAAKAALLATMIERGVNEFIPYSQARDNLAYLRLAESVPVRLARLRRNNPEAFYYWVITSELL